MRFQPVRSFVFFALAAPLLAQVSEIRTFERVHGELRDAGVLHLATGSWTRGVSSQSVGLPGSEIVFNNTVPSSYYTPLNPGETVVSYGRLPSTSSPEVVWDPLASPVGSVPGSASGCADSYTIDGFQISYCSQTLGPNVSMSVAFYQSAPMPCSGTPGGPPTGGPFLLSGLPGRPATVTDSCWVFNVDLAGTTSSFVMLADGDGFSDSWTLDLFAWTHSFPSTTSTAVRSGEYIAGCPVNGKSPLHPGFGWREGLGAFDEAAGYDGTRFDGPTGAMLPTWPANGALGLPTPAGEHGTSPSRVDTFRLEGGSVYAPGCYFFGGPIGSGGSWDGPFSNCYLELYADLIDSDLVVSPFSAPTQGFTGEAFTLTWTVVNQGLDTVDGSWTDTVFLSTDAAFDFGDTPLVSLVQSGPLASGASYQRTAALNYPATAGDYWLIVFTDAGGAVAECGREANNPRAAGAAVQVQIPMRPDLHAQVLQVPGSVVPSGASITVGYRVMNSGSASTSVPAWRDRIYLTTSSGGNPGSGVLLDSRPNPAGLAQGSYYDATATVVLPTDFSGARYIAVVTDANGEVVELNEGNNGAFSSAFFDVLLEPQPDLTPANIRFTTAPPVHEFSGNFLTVLWDDVNQGNSITDSSSWTDRLFLSLDNQPSISAGDLLASTLGFGTGFLAGGASASRTATLLIPPNLDGPYYVKVQADSSNAISEFGGGLESNNVAASSTPVIVDLSITPDLHAVSIAPTGAGPLLAGHGYSVTWTVDDLGFANWDTGFSWTDALYLSANTTFEAGSDILLTSAGQSATFSPSTTTWLGTNYTKSVGVTVPQGVSSGTWHLLLLVDVNAQVFEFVSDGLVPPQNIGESNNFVVSAPLTILVQPTDLVVAPNAPIPTSEAAGQPLQLSFTVTNQGVATTPVSGWNDRVHLSIDTSFSQNDPFVANAGHAGALTAGASYTVTTAGTVPLTTPGNYFLLFVTDPFNEVWELGGESNNVVATPFTVSAQAADLEVASPINTADVVDAGQALLVEWTVVNNGTLPTTSGAWTDRIYLSVDSAPDGGDLVLGSRTHSGVLAAGANYVSSAAFSVPITFNGLFYVIVATDADGGVLETNDANNTRFRRMRISVTAASPANLVVLNPSAPAGLVSGQSLLTTWTEKNIGSGSTSVSSWADSVYLSLDTILDAGADRFLGSIEEQGFLAPNEQRVVNAAFVVPLGVSGSYYVLVKTNTTNVVYEGGATNDNLTATPSPTVITLPPVSDLRVSSVQGPASGAIGQPLSITWTTTNDSGGTVSGSWTDSFFLSADGSLDAGDTLLGEGVNAAGSLAVGGLHVQTQSFDVPGVLPGTFFVLASSDARNQILESDESDNLTTSLGSVALGTIDIADDGAPVQQSLPLGAARYWRLVVPPGPAETLRVRLVHSNPSAWTELFASRDEIPHPGLADFSFTTLGASTQELVLPDVDGGTYYVLARAPFNAGRGAPTGTLTVDVLPFSLLSVEPARAGTGIVTLELLGSQMHTLASVDLRRTGTAEIIGALQILPQTSASALAAFDLSSATLGDYDVLVQSTSALTSELAGVLTVEPATPRAAGLVVEYPPSVKKGATGVATVTLENHGNVNLSRAALVLARRTEPLLELRSEELSLPALETDGLRDSLVLFVADLGPSQRALVHLECDVAASYPSSAAVFALAGRPWTDAAWQALLVPVSAETLRQAVLADPSSGSGLLQRAASSALWLAAVQTNLAPDASHLFVNGTLPGTGRAWMAELAVAATTGLPSIDLVPAGALAAASSELACSLFSGTGLDCLQLEPDECGAGIASVISTSVDGANIPVIVVCGATPTSKDPNEKNRPAGFGPQALISAEQPVPYRVYFENVPTAGAPASHVEVRDPLQPTLRLSSFRPTRVSFGSTQIDLPTNTVTYQNTVDLSATLGVRLQMSIGVNAARNEAFWIFQSLDPLTGLPITDGQRGFLPPNDATGVGQGYVDFLISSSPGFASTGTQVRNSARITFDQNPALLTNEVQNVLDADRPASALGVSTVAGSDFDYDLAWSGSDGPQGAGLANYSVYASRDNGPYIALVTDTVATSARFTAVPGSTYRFYSRARDHTGNTETLPLTPDSTFVAPADCNSNGRSDARDVSEQTSADCDANLVPDECQPDADGDSAIDACDPCPLDATNDGDSDGVCGLVDNCPAVANSGQANLDGDALGDACDPCPMDANNDADADGLCANVDNCPAVANAGQNDADGDGLGDACDPCSLDAANDGDGDGVCANADNCPAVANGGQANVDGDALGDACDPCPLDAANDADGDGLCAEADNCPAVANAGQANADGDALGDACDACPLDAANDADADGLCANVDNCPAVANAGQNDADGDGLGDACDPCALDAANDADLDGVCANADNCPTVANANQIDADGDALGDACDPCPLDAANDVDGDGLCAEVDNCPTVANSGQANTDSDALGDACDACPLDPLNDADADAVCGDADNCPSVANASQTNSDGDALGDACDICPFDGSNDVDADGICGDVDNCPAVANASQANADGDPLGDACDTCPLDASNDADGDGLCANADNCPTVANQDQSNADADAFGDACDACPLDPLDDLDLDGVCGDADNCPSVANANQAEVDGDGVGDACDVCPLDPLNDEDGDGVCGDVDNCPTAANASQANADGDAEGDACDACPLDPLDDADGDGVCADVDNCPTVANATQANADGDALGDPCDTCPLDAANDGDGDGACANVDNCPTVTNPGQADADGDALGDVCDLCQLDPLNDVDVDGICGDVDNCPSVTNASQTDSDGDAAGDACDACPLDALDDVDGDGVCGDVDNCPNLANPSQTDCNANQIGDACEGAPDCNSNSIPDTCDVASGASQDFDANGVPDECQNLMPFCFGDGPANGGPACPCGNDVPAGVQRGCANSTGAGAQLVGAGITSLSADALVLTVSGMSNFTYALFVQGELAAGGGAGTAPFHDGLLCLDGTLARLGTRTSAAGVAALGTPGTAVSLLGGVVVPGPRTYQVVYRNVVGPCQTGANSSNGLRVLWTP